MATSSVATRYCLIGPNTPGLPREAGIHNVNGPSVLAMPPWAAGLGRYHMYFAHHGGATIRLAYSDEVAGPWQVHHSPALHVDQTPAWGPTRHIASPDVHVDDATRTVRMYYHSPVGPDFPSSVPQPEPWRSRQQTHIAASSDGISFAPIELGHAVAPPYLRMWRGADAWFGIAMPDVTITSPDGISGFEPGPRLVAPTTRHVGVDATGGRVSVFFTRVGDAPERIVASELLNADDITRWRLAPPQEVLRPTLDWEGAAIDPTPSRYGAADHLENALRDPYPLRDAGRRWLFYAAGGEQAIGAVAL